MKGFLAELKRRNVLRAALLYAGALWALAQGVAQLAPELGLPAWSARAFIVAGAIGLPFWLLFAWFYELTPDGLKRESEVPDGASIARQTGRRLDYWIIGVLAVAVVLLLTDRLVLREPADAGAAAPHAIVHHPAEAIPFASIAVLPLANASSDEAQDFFAEGLTEELIAGLSKLAGLKVVGRSSSARFKGSTEASARIGEQLGVAHLLEGSVRRQADRMRISVNLLAAADGRSLWAQSFDRGVSDIFAVQSEIARAVATALRVQLVETDRLLDEWPPGGDVEAYLAFIEARALQRTSTSEGLTAALALLQRAIALDRRYAYAHAALALVNGNLFSRATDDPVAEAGYRADALAALDRALALAPDMPLVMLVQSELLATLKRDYRGAEAVARRAYALYPDHPLAMSAMFGVLQKQGRYAEVLDVSRRLVAIDPLRTHFLRVQAHALAMLGRLDEAEQVNARAIALEPTYAGLYSDLATLGVLRGDVTHALQSAEREVVPGERLGALAQAHAAAGDRARALSLLEEMDRTCNGHCFGEHAVVYGLLGEHDAAYDALEKAVARAQADNYGANLLSKVLLRRYWPEPRFRALAARNGTPVPAEAEGVGMTEGGAVEDLQRR